MGVGTNAAARLSEKTHKAREHGLQMIVVKGCLAGSLVSCQPKL
jgi:hypothetical protein